MSEKKAVTVTIYGNEYTLKGEADPQYILELAKFVDAKMNEIGKKSSAPAAKVAILASMNIADELHRLEKSKVENLKLIETLEKSLLEMKKASDGSLKHTLELKEQSDRIKGEAAEAFKKLEDAQQAARGSESLKIEAERAKKDLEAANQRTAELSRETERLKGELQKVKPDLENLRKQLEAAEKRGEDAKMELNDLRTQTDHLSSELKRAKSSPAPAHSASPNFLPTEEKMAALFRKIDAILE